MTVHSSDTRPLAARMRPNSLDQVVGQSHLLGNGKPLRRVFETKKLHSMILWGAPGTGKTTLARLLSEHTGAEFESLSAVLSGVKEIRLAIQRALDSQQRLVLFIDEIHRFNKAQQDAFLPYVENGHIILIGATTENPSFEVNNALLSRVRVYVLKRLTNDDIIELLQQALQCPTRGYGATPCEIDSTSLQMIAETADGDARRALNLLEMMMDLVDTQEGRIVLDETQFKALLTQSHRQFDKGGDQFYDQISALHKSVRGTDPDAALYWFARMLDGGCDPLYIARRVIRMACEDIGIADPKALTIALDAAAVYERLGSPEGHLAIAEALVYLSCTAKSNAVYTALKAAEEDVARYGSLEVPHHLRNAPTRLMKEQGFGDGYRYPHDEPDAFAMGVCYLPDALPKKQYYHPTTRGLEAKIKEKLSYVRSKTPTN